MIDSLWCPLFSVTQVLCRSVFLFWVGVFLHLKRCVQLVLLDDVEVLVGVVQAEYLGGVRDGAALVLIV